MKQLVFPIIITLYLFSNYSLKAQSCDFYSHASVCVNQEVSFYADCGSTINWYVNGVYQGSGAVFNHTFTSIGSYQITMTYSSGGGGDTPIEQQQYPDGSNFELVSTIESSEIISNNGSITKTVEVVFSPTPQLVANKNSLCDHGDVLVSVSNPILGSTYTWHSNIHGNLGNGESKSIANLTQNTTFTVQAINQNGCNLSSTIQIEVKKTEVEPFLEPISSYRKSTVTPVTNSYQSYLGYFWQSSSTGVDESNRVLGSIAVSDAKTLYIRYKNSIGNCWTVAKGPVHVSPNTIPPPAESVSVQRAGYNEVKLFNDDLPHILNYANFYWVKDNSSNPEIISAYSRSSEYVNKNLFTNGTYYLKGKDKATNTWGSTREITITLRGDDGLNWIHTKAFDGTTINGTPELTIISESKSYFDDAGKPLQTQTKSKADTLVFASQSLTDKYDRVVGSSLSAPILPKEFTYNELFITDHSGNAYTYEKFDGAKTLSPDPVGDSIPGTLGWYYGPNNKLEKFVPVTSYPYSRTEFYDDGTGEAKRSASPGDVTRLGTGHEILSGTFPVFDELNDYISKRSLALPGIFHDGSLRNEGVQSVARDQNGKYAISITDKEGKNVLSARNGTSASDGHVLKVENVVISNAIDSSPNFRKLTYFYILNNQPVNITGSSDAEWFVENIVTNEKLSLKQTFADINGKWPVGFYRLTLLTGEITLRYTHYFQDVSYQFYDDLGRLKVSVSPNGYKSWKTGTSYADIDKTTYTYNYKGWLLNMTEPDAGKSQYVYRTDGKIRFSQNAEQKKKNKFSYTHYDGLGRPIESGEYKTDAIKFIPMDSADFTASAMKGQLNFENQVIFNSTSVADWVKTYYDLPDTEFQNATGLNLNQEFVRGAVSYTENENIKTWYSYDELGRVVWMVQKPKALFGTLKRVFISRYTYDFLGSVLTTSNSMALNGSEVSSFFHHYDYDANRRLSQVFTSTDGNTKKLRASYKYYKHGPLKRIELGDKVQGIDFIYNINGWLTQINHPDKNQDPGGDGTNDFRADAFGMILDYYESTITNLYQTAFNPMPKSPKQHHGIPETDTATLLASHASSSLITPGASDWIKMVKEELQKSAQSTNQSQLQTK
jgi:hypothetical protein